MLFSLLYFQPHRLENCRCHRRSTITRSAKKKVDDQKSVKKEKKDCKRPLVAPFFNNADVLSSILLKNIVFRFCLHELSFSFFSVFNKYLVFFCIYLHMQTYHCENYSKSLILPNLRANFRVKIQPTQCTI